MINAFKGRARSVAAALAALGIAIGISAVAVVGTATAASAESVEAAAYPRPVCTTGTGSTGDNPTSRTYAWARCKDMDGDPNVVFYSFRVKWSCTHDSRIKYGSWHVVDNSTLRGYCPAGEFPDISSVEIRDGFVD